ncbi:hypothetical protein [Roseovarius pacificus]|uniref:hypothetical protein n=1 Tax=Roseovarius pacificus TaxID=337701 RepID=UPI00296A343A|nr:hypothetical protein [Roseovarius pacificus]
MTTTLTKPEDFVSETLTRVDAALSDPKTSWDKLERLRAETEVAIEGARNIAESLQIAALSPSQSREEAAKAREEAEGAAHDLRRLEAAHKEIEAKWEEALRSEREAERRKQYDQANAECKELVAKYPEVAEALDLVADFLNQLIDADETIDAVNRDLPMDAAPLTRTEGRIRGFTDYGEGHTADAVATFRLSQAILPDLKNGGCAWPPFVPDWQIQQTGRLFSYGDVRRRYRLAREDAERKAKKGASS